MYVTSCFNLRDQHLPTGFEKQESPPDFVHQDHRYDGGQDIDDTRDDRGEQRRVVLESDGLEEDRSIKHDGVDPGELLEDLHHDGDHQLRAARSLHEVPERLLHLPCHLAGTQDLLVLRIHVVGPSDLRQHGQAFHQLLPLDEARRRLGDHEGSQAKHGRRHAGQAKRESPSPGVDIGHEVVHDVGHEDPDRHIELEEDVQGSPDADWRDLRQEERNRLQQEERTCWRPASLLMHEVE
ncbi:unnamed protein product [Musa acuminata subsp. burmannicoides]